MTVIQVEEERVAEEEEIMIIIDHPIEEVGVEGDTEDLVHQTPIIKVVEEGDIAHVPMVIMMIITIEEDHLIIDIIIDLRHKGVMLKGYMPLNDIQNSQCYVNFYGRRNWKMNRLRSSS